MKREIAQILQSGCFVCACLFAVPVMSQSALTLEDFEIEAEGTAEVKAAEDMDFQFEVMRLGTKCQDWMANAQVTQKRDAPMDLDDVVNLGMIVDHEAEAEETCLDTPEFYSGQPLLDLEFARGDWVPRDFKTIVETERESMQAAHAQGFRFLIVGYAPMSDRPLRDMEIAVARASLVAEYLSASVAIRRDHIRQIGLLPAKTAPLSGMPELWDRATVYLERVRDRAIALQKPLISVRRKSLLQPAFLNLPRFDPFAGLALMMLKAIRLKAAKLAGA